ncbi:MAG: hypothetical protein JXA52_07705, partial [Planctomycetes bacterium]|nr:hypothetical protein [Planctomycetota bacterium]
MRKLLAALAVLMLLISPLMAHDGSWVLDVGSFEEVVLGHEEDPEVEPYYKGWAIITVTNTMNQAWGDFHFCIYEPMSYNVIFPDTEVMEMLNSAGLPYEDGDAALEYTYVHNGTQALDFYFYDAPIMPGETVTFKLYTD